MTNLVHFNNHNIELIQYNNQPYMTLRQIGGALEYARLDKISTIYNEHKSEFDEEMSCLVRRGNTRVRIFNREGAWLIGMFARTPKAAEFRRWVLKVLGTTIDKVYPCGEVNVREHTRSLLSGKKEIVLSEKAKTEIGGIVKSCMAAAIREELADLLDFTQVKGQELSGSNLIYLLYRWHSTKSEVDLKKFQQVTSENQALKIKLAKIKQAVA